MCFDNLLFVEKQSKQLKGVWREASQHQTSAAIFSTVFTEAIIEL